MAVTPRDPDLEPIEIHEILSNERRQLVLTYLREAGGTLTARELAIKIAEAETGESPPPENIRQSAYVSLHQTHLPKLDELKVVYYDRSDQTITLQQRADQVSVYMETVPKFGLSWSEVYAATGLLGLLVLLGGEVGVPILTEIGSTLLSVTMLGAIAVIAAYQTYNQRSSILHRLLQARGRQ